MKKDKSNLTTKILKKCSVRKKEHGSIVKLIVILRSVQILHARKLLCLTLHKNPKNIFSLFSLILSKFFFYNYEVGFLQSSSLVCKSFQFMCAACITPIFLSYYGILSIFFFLRTMHNKGTHLRKNMNAEKLLLVNFITI